MKDGADRLKGTILDPRSIEYHEAEKALLSFMSDMLNRHELNSISVHGITITKNSFAPKAPKEEKPKPLTPEEIEAQEEKALFYSSDGGGR